MVPTERRADWRIHRVAAGETLAGIGKAYGVTPTSIASANNLKSAEAQEGDRLVIPVAHVQTAPARRTSRTPARSSHTASHRAPARSRSTHTSASTHKTPVIVASNN